MIEIKIQTTDNEYQYEIEDGIASSEFTYVEAIEKALAQHCLKCGIPFKGYFIDTDK